MMLLAVGGLFASCDPDAESWTPGEAPAEGNACIYIADKVTNTVEVDPSGDTSFDITLARPDSLSENESTVNITVLQNDDDVFTVPETATFAAGETKTTVNVTTQNYTPGEVYTLQIAVAGDNVNQYTSEGLLSATYNFSALKWETYKTGKGYIEDNGLLAALWGNQITPVLLQISNIEKAQTATETRYRFASPYCGVATAVDDRNAYDYYPFNDPENIVATGLVYTITITSAGAAFQGLCSLGIDYGYGTQAFNSQARITPKGDVLTFPAKSLAVFDDDGGVYSTTDIVVYLSEEAYDAAHAKADPAPEEPASDK